MTSKTFNPELETACLFPLTFAQQRLWFLNEFEPGARTTYLIPWSIRIRGAVDIEALERSLNEIVRRHEVFRTTFRMLQEEPVQVVTPELHIPLPVFDLRQAVDPQKEAERRASAEWEDPLELEHGPLLRACILRVANEEYRLLLTTHHIIFDGWSRSIMVREMSACYEAFVSGRAPVLPDLPIQYADYAVWQREQLRGERLERLITYWRSELEGAPTVLELPTDRPRPAMQSYNGAACPIVLPRELTERLRALCQCEQMTLYMALLGAWSVLLGKYSGQEDICIGSPIANRNRAELEGLIGFFANTIVLRTRLQGNPSFREVLHRVKQTALSVYAHQEIPFEKLVEELKPERNLSHNPLFQVLFSLRNTPTNEWNLPGLKLDFYGSSVETAKFDLSFFLTEQDGEVRGRLEYNTDLFDPATIERMLGQYVRLLEGVVEAPERSIAELELLSREEREQVLVAFNATQAELPRDQRLHDFFEAQVVATPERTALVWGDERWTYAQLNARANQIAHALERRGVGPEQLVGVYLDRTPLLVAALLGVLKAGGAYVPLDPNYPTARLQAIVEDAQPRCILTRQALLGSWASEGSELVCVDEQAIEAEATSNPGSAVESQQLAYVLFTSGSTGRPKGVAIEHRSAAAFLAWTQTVFSPEQLAGMLFSTSMCFDLSVFEIFAPLSVGGNLILAENALALPTLAARAEVTFLNTVPSAMAELVRLEGVPESVRTVALAGEALAASLVEAIYEKTKAEQVYNLYGPTEDTTYSTYTRVERRARVTIGRPIANTQAYILDERRRPVPIGVSGELYLAGAGLARGYYGKPELTAERFVPNPFASAAGARMYRTGDLCRWLKNGEIEYLGRIDQQVKLRGFRIELGEIESVLAQHAGVRQSVVVVREDQPGDQRLVAYVVAEPEVRMDAEELRRHLKRSLPEYMVPSAFVSLEALPLSANGKIDRNRLPPPSQADAATTQSFVPPHTPLEMRLAEIWQEVLGVARVGLEDDFFELGGHSLLAVKMMAQVREVFGRELPLALLFQAPELGALAHLIRENASKYRLPTLIPIRKTGTKPPLFCISRPNVNALGYMFLSRRLSTDIPVYGLQSQLEHDGYWWVFTEEEYRTVAAEYIVELRRAFPEGPYLLAGYCEGAHIAFEMARQLEQAGQKVGMLVILDAWPVENTVDPIRYRISGVVRLALRRYRRIKRRLMRALGRVPESTTAASDRPIRGNPELELRARTDPEFKRQINDLIRSRYWPGKDWKPTTYSGELLLLRTDRQRFYRRRDYQLGWGSRALGGVVVRMISGEHNKILREPQVAEVAQHMEEYIQHPQTYGAAQSEAPKAAVSLA